MKRKTQPKPEVVWLYDILDMMCGLSFCIYERATQRLLRDDRGAMHFTTAEDAIGHAVKLAKRHKYDDLVRDLPWH